MGTDVNTPPPGFVLDNQGPTPPPGFVMDSGVQQVPEQKPFLTKAQETLGQLKSIRAGEGLLAAADIAAKFSPPSMIASGVGAVTGGMAGLTAASAPEPANITEREEWHDYEEGRPAYWGKPDPAKAVETQMDRYTYEPRTEIGQQVTEIAQTPFRKYEELMFEGAYQAGEPTDVEGATGAYTALMFLPAVVGTGLLGKGKRVPRSKSRLGTASQSLKKQADALYKQADAAQGGVTAQSYDGVLQAIANRLAKEGFDPALNPKTNAALQNLQGKSGNNQTFMGTEINRRVINNARDTLDKADARMANIMLDTYDDWMMNLSRSDVVFGDPKVAGLYREARSLWHRKMKVDELEWAIERANNRASANYSGAAFETAVRQEFKAILNNKRRRRMFNEAELAAIKSVSDGTLPQNFLRLIGKFAFRGPVSGATGMYLGTTINPIVGAAIWGVGEAAKRGATAMAKGQTQRAIELAERGQ